MSHTCIYLTPVFGLKCKLLIYFNQGVFIFGILIAYGVEITTNGPDKCYDIVAKG